MFMNNKFHNLLNKLKVTDSQRISGFYSLAM